MKDDTPIESTSSQALLNKIVLEYMLEKKRKRFWQWVKRIVISLLVHRCCIGNSLSKFATRKSKSLLCNSWTQTI